MNTDFEFRQLMRAYRSGLISEATFESEMAKLEGKAGANGHGFKAFGKTYKCERDAVVSFLDKVRAGEAGGGEAFAAWAAVCTTDCIRSGLRMVSERESYHSRIFEQRLLELGGEKRAGQTEQGRKFRDTLADPSIPDNEKLLMFTRVVGEPKDAVKPIQEFIALIKEDEQTKEALKLFCEDEFSTATWLWNACAALNAPAKPANAEAARATA
ncbi:MAG TPA: hypothetical protein VEF03_04090 [Candidatus Binataceae bacterium]|nr:hypothetical protein [Candidatus Binataceae bacterium]